MKTLNSISWYENWQLDFPLTGELFPPPSSILLAQMGSITINTVLSLLCFAVLIILFLLCWYKIKNQKKLLEQIKTAQEKLLDRTCFLQEILVEHENKLEEAGLLNLASKTGNGNGDAENDFICRLNRLLQEHLTDDTATVETFAHEMHMSRTHFFRRLKALTNQSPNEFIRNYRLDKAKELLENRKGNVTQVSMMVGFGSEKYFSTKFKERFGCSPSEIKLNNGR